MGQFIGGGVDARIQLAARHGTANQAYAFGLFGIEHVAGQQIFLGACVADQLRPDNGTAVARHITHLDMRVAESCIVYSDRDVA